jgi:hypothetical protein
VNFCGTKGILQDFAVTKSYFYLSSDHSPISITLQADGLHEEKESSLTNKHTNRNGFRRLVIERLTLNITLKTEEDTNAAVKIFNDIIQ